MITVNQIKGLSPRNKKYIKSCGTKNNLSIIVNPSGKKTFIYRYTPKGKTTPKQIELGIFPAISLKDASEKADFYHNLLRRGEDPKDYYTEKQAITPPTFKEAFELYYNQKLINLKSRRNQQLMVEADVMPVVGDKLLKDVKKKHILKAFDRLADRGSLGQANRLHARLKHFFKWAEFKEMINYNPMSRIPKEEVGKSEEIRNRYLSIDEIKIFWNWLEELGFDESYKVALKILLLTAQRINTLCIAEWKDIDLDKKEWFIPAKNQKTGTSQLVFLSDYVIELFKLLRKYSPDSPYPLASVKDQMRHTSKDPIQKALKRALDVEFSKPNPRFKERFVIHDFRKTFSSNMNEKGGSTFAIEKILSHKLTGILAVYNHSEYHDLKKKVWLEWSRIIENLISGENKIINLKAGGVKHG